MKRLLIAFFALTLVATSCNDVEDLADVTFDATFKADLNFDVPPSRDMAGTFAASAAIDPTVDPMVEKYLDKIKSWEIIAITGEIVEINKDNVNLETLQTEIYSETQLALWTHGPITPLQVGSSITLDNANGQWNTVEQILDEKIPFTVGASGAIDQNDVQFTLQITIQTRITANPL